MDLCPLIFESRLLPKVWGGRRLAAFGKELPEGQAIGESWELFDDERGSAKVALGPAKGRDLRSLSEEWGAALVGPGHEEWGRRFPLLIKLLDARQDLSVQVHPDDALARELEGPGSLGKNEMWLVLDCAPGARLLSGFRRGVDKAAFAEALETGGVVGLLNWVDVAPGDVLDIPAGRVHALGAGILVAEVQQNSDLTYRVWDYGRLENGRPRALHMDQALRSLRFDEPFGHESGWLRAPEEAEDQLLVEGNHFSVRRLRIQGPWALDRGTFPRVVMALDQGLRLAWGAGQGMMVPAGATALIPAELDLELQGRQSRLLLIEPR